MKFGHAFPHILQEIWEADLVQGSVRLSSMDVTDAYHCCTLRPAQVGYFPYVVPGAAKYNCLIICIDLVLPMVWVGSPKYFCAILETLTDVANALVHMLLPVP